MEAANPVPAHVPADVVVDFDVYDPPKIEEGLQQAWMTLQRPGGPSLVWSIRNGGHWIATRGEDIARFYADFERLSSRVLMVPREKMIGNRPIPISSDRPEHTAYRGAVNPSLTPRAIQEIEGGIRQLVVKLVDGLREKGRCDFVSEFALVVPLTVFMRYADLPPSQLPRLRQLAEEKVRPTGKMTPQEIMIGFADFLRPIVEERIGATDRSDMFSRVLSKEVFGRPVTVDEGIRLCSQIIVAALDTTAGTMGHIFTHLAMHPEARKELREHRDKIPGAIEEYLRRFPLVAMARYATQDFQHDGITVKEGDLMVLPTMLHGLDPTITSSPYEVDFDRKNPSHSSFGQGPHRCPGATLARLELGAAVEAWLDKIPDFSIADGAPIKYHSGLIGSMSGLHLEWPVSSHG